MARVFSRKKVSRLRWLFPRASAAQMGQEGTMSSGWRGQNSATLAPLGTSSRTSATVAACRVLTGGGDVDRSRAAGRDVGERLATGGNRRGGLVPRSRDVPRYFPLCATFLLRVCAHAPACVRDWGTSRDTAGLVLKPPVNTGLSSPAMHQSTAGLSRDSKRVSRDSGPPGAWQKRLEGERFISHPRSAARCRRRSGLAVDDDDRRRRGRRRPGHGRRPPWW